MPQCGSLSGVLAVDYSFSHPAPLALKQAGVDLVVRYTTGDKAITPDEAKALRQLGIAIALVHETASTGVNTSGSAGGRADCMQSQQFGDQLGYPADGVLFFADDAPPSVAGAAAYFTGVREVSGKRPIGWYGGMQVGEQLKAAGLVDIIWVADAASWSGYDRWSDLAPVARANPQVSMLQSLDHPLPGIAPSSYDLDELLHPFPCWGIEITPPASPKPIPPVIRIPGVTMDVTTLPLDSNGNGQVAVPGVAPDKVKGATIVGLHDPSDPVNGKLIGYTKIPRIAVDTHTGSAEVVLEDGVPGGRYVVRVEHA